MSEVMMRRRYWREVRVGDGVRSVPCDGGNGRLWSGEVTAVETVGGGKVRVTCSVHGRSLCAEDLTYGFGNHRGESGEVEHREVVYTLTYDADAALFRKVNYKGRRVWDGHEVTGRGGEGVEYVPRSAVVTV